MEMEFMAEFTEGISRDRALQIIKRKRTKRHRPCSPFHMSSSASGSGSGSGSGDCLIDYSKVDQSPVTSSETSTKEDEDMANCLIMLAQSVSVSVSPGIEEKSDLIPLKTERLSSRRFTEMNTATGKADVYECKTCNRTFQSFQALGGHRASHKKPKVNVEEKKHNSVNNMTLATTECVEEDDDNNNSKAVVVAVEEDEENKASIVISTNVHKSPSQTRIINNNNNKVKVHECSICGSEFLSGQALGGHMRKHRPIPPVNNRTGIATTNDESTADQMTEKSPAGSGGMLTLDLNFPPPEVVEDHRSTFPFTGGSSQQHMVFSAPAFVDCHY